MTEDAKQQAAEFEYVNYRGETARRKVVPISIKWGSTEWHPEEQWLLKAYDLEKEAIREFALKDCRFINEQREGA